MKGVILVNAYEGRANVLNQSKRLKEELEKRGAEAEIMPCSFLCASDGELKIDLKADFVVYLDKDKYTSEMLEKGGFRLFNSAEAVRVCDDKMTTFIRLSGQGIPMPLTLPAPLCYLAGETEKEEHVGFIGRTLGYPLVVKGSFGSLGGEVFLARDRHELKQLCDALILKPHLYQKFVAESAGHDMRVILVGGKVVAAMERINGADFRSNIELGGRGVPAEVPSEVRDICERAAAVIGLDYCGADVLYGKDGPLLCEVNSNAFFGGIERVTGVNVAAIYAEHILNAVGSSVR